MVDSCGSCERCKQDDEQYCMTGMTPTYNGKCVLCALAPLFVMSVMNVYRSALAMLLLTCMLVPNLSSRRSCSEIG